MAAWAALACSEECVVEADDPNSPAPAVECAADQACYRGRCVAACNAGLELFELCDRAQDCREPRPNCVQGFCSACDANASCVPGLDVCQPIAVIPRPDAPPRPDDGSQVPPGPLDASVPVGFERFPDQDPGPPPDREITRTARFDFVRGTRLDGAGRPTFEPTVSVHAWDVRGTGPGRTWRPEFSPPRLQSIQLEPNGDELRDEQCELRVLTTPTVAVSRTDLGLVRFQGAATGEEFDGILGEWRVEFDGASYRATPIAAEDELFESSIPGAAQQGSLLTTGSGAAAITAGGYSSESHVPFVLVPTSSTSANLATGWRTQGNRELLFAWRDPIRSGVLVGEAVYVEIDAPQAGLQIACEETEGPSGSDDIVIRTRILRAFADGAGPGTYVLRFGRKNERVVAVPPSPDELIDAVVRIAQEFRSTLTVLPR
jgi:hypothetical protein